MSGLNRGSLAEAVRRWALLLTQQPSVTGSADEEAFGPWLAERLREHPAFRGRAEVWTMPVAAGDGRHCVFMLLRGTGRRTAILTGHYDTVSVEDYGALRSLAIEPDALLQAFQQGNADLAGPAGARARADFASGAYLPGRGLLDMKAGLAAGLGVCESFPEGADGNLLFIAVPDEENNSAGARAAAPALAEIAAARGLDFVAAINLDAIADNDDGTLGRVVALGTVGKLLPTALVVGVPTHSGFPFHGLNAGALAASIAARVEWATELTEGEMGTPPSLLSLRDGKTGYDVTTPATAFLTLNVLSHRRSPTDVLDRFDALCGEAVDAHRAALQARSGGKAMPPPVALHRYAAVEAAALARAPENGELLKALDRELGATRLPLPERCRIKTERAWMLSGLEGPAVVSGFGSIPYPPTNLSDAPDAAQLEQACRTAAGEALSRHGSPVSCVPTFAGISDMSFFGEADAGALGVVAANTPLWATLGWPEGGGIANIPTVNIGPWGRDYHTPLERLHAPYAFEVLPGLLLDVLAGLGIFGKDWRLRPAPQQEQGTLR